MPINNRPTGKRITFAERDFWRHALQKEGYSVDAVAESDDKAIMPMAANATKLQAAKWASRSNCDAGRGNVSDEEIRRNRGAEERPCRL